MYVSTSHHVSMYHDDGDDDNDDEFSLATKQHCCCAVHVVHLVGDLCWYIGRRSRRRRALLSGSFCLCEQEADFHGAECRTLMKYLLCRELISLRKKCRDLKLALE